MSPRAKSKAALRCARAPSSAPRLRGGRLSGHLLPQAGEGLGRVFAGPRKTSRPAPCGFPAPPCPAARTAGNRASRSEEHTSELQSLMRISYAVFCLKNKKTQHITLIHHNHNTTPYYLL